MDFYNYLQYKEIRKRIRWEQGALEKIQLMKINRILENISASNGYYDYLEGRFDSVQGIRSLPEIRKIPVTTKRQLQAFTENFKNNNLDKNTISLTTSGSTVGKSNIFLSSQENALRAASFFRMLSYNGYNWNDIIFSLLQPQYIWLKKKRWYSYFGLVREVAVDYLTDINKQIGLFLTTNPTVLRGRTKAIYKLAKEIRRIKPRKNIRLVFTTGEQLSTAQRQFIQDTFNCTVIDYYSTTECGIIAWECTKRNGYHIDMDNIFLELIFDSVTNKYKIVVTNLNALHFPIIRYNLDDFSSGIIEHCSCNCSFPIMKDIEGHKNFDQNAPEK